MKINKYFLFSLIIWFLSCSSSSSSNDKIANDLFNAVQNKDYKNILEKTNIYKSCMILALHDQPKYKQQQLAKDVISAFVKLLDNIYQTKDCDLPSYREFLEGASGNVNDRDLRNLIISFKYPNDHKIIEKNKDAYYVLIKYKSKDNCPLYNIQFTSDKKPLKEIVAIIGIHDGMFGSIDFIDAKFYD